METLNLLISKFDPTIFSLGCSLVFCSLISLMLLKLIKAIKTIDFNKIGVIRIFFVFLLLISITITLNRYVYLLKYTPLYYIPILVMGYGMALVLLVLSVYILSEYVSPYSKSKRGLW